MGNHNRITGINKTIHEVQKRMKTKIDKQLNDALNVERENIKQLIGDSANAMIMH